MQGPPQGQESMHRTLSCTPAAPTMAGLSHHHTQNGSQPTLEASAHHASPMQRCRMRKSSGGVKRTRPHARHTRSDDVARSTEIESQMMGNAMPGGVHEGRFVSTGVALPFCAERLGRLAGSGEKIRERSERKKKSGQTSGARSVTRASVARKSAAIRPTWVTTASLYLPIASQSIAASDGGAC
eukprot:2491092-Pleurochrysis_carterae.AAC.3